MLPHTFRLVARCSIASAWRFLSQPYVRFAPLVHYTQPRRHALSTHPPQTRASHLTMERYHQLSDATMDNLFESLENLLDGVGRSNYEVEYHSGVLTLTLGDNGTYVINKQPPNKQIWLSSPLSGPKRYDYSEELADWIYSRDSRTMGDLLNDELSKAVERHVDLRQRKP